MRMSRSLPTLCAILLFTASLAGAQDPPEFRISPALREWFIRRTGSAGPGVGAVPDHARPMLLELEAVADRHAAAAFFHRFARREAAVGSGDSWVADLLSGPLREEVSALGADLYPPTIRLLRITTRDGKSLTGSVRSLASVFSWMDVPLSPKAVGDQFELTLGRGMPGLSYGLWIDGDALTSRQEVEVPSPRWFAARVERLGWDTEGRLIAAAVGCRPPAGPAEETLLLEPRYVESGGGLFVEESLNLEHWMEPDLTPEGRTGWARARRRAERDHPEADLRTGRMCVDLRFLEEAEPYLAAAESTPRTATAARRLRAEWTSLRIEQLLAPSLRAEGRGELDLALRTLSDLPEPARQAADERAVALEAKLEATVEFLDRLRVTLETVPENLRPPWLREVPDARRVDSVRCAAWRAASAGVPEDPDPLRRLLRLWVLYHYGECTADPAAVVGLEERMRRFLAAVDREEGPALDELLAHARASGIPDPLVLAVARHVPWLEPAPPGGRLEFPHPTRGTHFAFAEFPDSYGPWSRVPVLLAHHGQSSSAEQQFSWGVSSRWLPVTDHGLALVCPEYGSINGVGRTLQDDLDTLALVRWLRLRTNVDPNRFYITGSSMGGAQTWHLSQTYPDAWAVSAPDNRAPASPLIPSLLRNLATLPLYHMQGQFNGKSNAVSRQAIERLAAWKSDPVYREQGLYGHNSSWMHYPELIRWMLGRSRPASPTEITLGTCKSYAAERAWLRIRSLRKPVAWAKTDGGYSPADVVSVEARSVAGAIDIRLDSENRRCIREIEVFLDDRLHPTAAGIELRLNGKKAAVWQPRRDLRRALLTMKRRGDRECVYPDSAVIRVEASGLSLVPARD